jgi:hypothetical protein
LVTVAITAGVGATTTGTAVADTSGETVVVNPGARFVPRATRVLNAGETGFLTAQEGDDRLRWIDYATGAATVLADPLPKPLEYDVEAGRPIDWGYYRFTAAADGTVTRKRVADIEDMPAQPAGISLGSGILTTADDSELFMPHTYIGSYRSTWLKTSGRPEEIETTVDGLTSGRDADCGWTDGSYCITMFASGDGFHGRKEGTEQGKTRPECCGATPGPVPAGSRPG